MRLIFIFIFSCVFFSSVYSQIVLKPHIGLNSMPEDSDTACYFTPYTGSFNASGYQAGDTVNDFTLFSYGGDTLNLRRELEKGKPVVLISCSYTCPVFRGKVPDINSLVAQYSDSVSIFLIYTIEAHPYIDISPYFGFVNTTQQNINEGILYRLARNYGERKYVVSRLDSGMTINAPVFIDGPCDPWLRNFGPAPNNAYLITTQGIVYSKHPWFNKAPLSMSHDIDSLFGFTGGGGGQYTGTFNFERLGDSIVYGAAGTTLYGHGQFVNNSDDTAVIRAVRRVQNLPSGWASSICIDVCYSPETDTAIFYLAPTDTQSYTMYFYTSNTPGNGMIRMIFENPNIQNNRYNVRFYASTYLSSVNNLNSNPVEFSLSQNYPNPFNPTTTIEFGIWSAAADPELENVKLIVYNAAGKEVAVLVNEILAPGKYNYQFSTVNYQLASGIYFYRLESGGFIETKRMILLK